jgi:membrane associated rhomboid family serine protease
MNPHADTLATVAEVLHCYRHPDRETYVSCSDCGRGICPDCMTFGPVGIRCPDHAGVAGRAPAPKRVARRASRSLSQYGSFVTFALIGINVGIYLLELMLGGQVNGTGNTIYEHGVLVDRAIDSSGQVIGVSEGEWWRLLTAAFLHYGPLHLGMNMLVLWFIGPALEEYLGHGRYALLYLVSGLAGSAGALTWSPNALTVGASGAIWGLMGAALILEWRKIYVFGGQALGLVVFNLAITFLIPGISIGGHAGGLVGGGVAALAFIYLRRMPALATLSVAAVGAVSVALALSQV